jgi:hypothetical protein
MHRLTEEVTERVAALAQIADRLLGRPSDPARPVRFAPNTEISDALPPYHHVEIECDSSGCTCFIYPDGGGVIAEHPCGAGGA